MYTSPGMESIALQSETNNVLKVLQEAGRAPVKIIDSDKEHTTLVRHVDQHPATGELQHVDFMRVDENKAIEVEVPVVLIGEAQVQEVEQVQLHKQFIHFLYFQNLLLSK